MYTRIENPILPGFHPDPSVCRVGEDYYIACSSFSFFPGIPIFKSRDLANWEQIGYALDRPSQARLTPERLSYGIWAPTLRYHAGRFYLIVGNWSSGRVQLMWAEHAEGPWSEPVYVEGAGGDPSLFFDDDGRVWCSYSAKEPDGTRGIFQRELDPESGCLIGEQTLLWHGALRNAHAPEASHVYKVGGYYYLLISEGGTEHYHAVCVARSEQVCGPYEGYAGNPILTHRHLSMYHPICNVGHADLFCTKTGQWYMAVLGSRLFGGYHKNLGRETFLCPVVWESGWPRPCADTGKVESSYPMPEGHEPVAVPQPAQTDGFDGDRLAMCWNYIGTPNNAPARLEGGKLFIRALPERIYTWPADVPPPDRARFLREPARALGFVGRRQEHMYMDATVSLQASFVTGSETAGLVILQNAYSQLRCELCRQGESTRLRVVRFAVVRTPALRNYPALDIKPEQSERVLCDLPWTGDSAVLRLSVRGQSHTFLAGPDAHSLVPVAQADAGFLGWENNGGFIGTYIGMFCSANGESSPAEAAFDDFSYVVCPCDGQQ